MMIFKGVKLIGVFFILFSVSCTTKTVKTYGTYPLKVQRFDADLASIDKYSLSDSTGYLLNAYPDFFPLYASKIISIGTPNQIGFGDRLAAFVTNKTIYQVGKRVGGEYANLNDIEKELSAAMGIYKGNFPGNDVPVIYTHISGFNQSVVTSENLISVSLDKYLGVNEKFYNLLYPPIPGYLRYNMHRKKISGDVVYALANMQFPFNAETPNLLSYMVHEGKCKYFTKAMLPQISDTLLWGFTPDQLRFCINNEESMWVYLIEQKLLFETNEMTVIKFVQPAPFTKDFTKESPGQAVNWIGYQIVQSYMNRNKETTLDALMNNNNYQEILSMARYNP